MPQCPNCSAEAGDEYCAQCGQRRIGPDDLSATQFVHEIVDEVATLHTKFKTLRSLRALSTPGVLTEHFLAGRRRPYLSPLKLYLVCAAVFFLAAPLAGFRLEWLIKDDQSGTLRTLVAAHEAERGVASALFNARFDLRLQSVYTIGMGVGVLAFALALQVLYFTKRLPFGAHLIFALHYVSFLYLITVVAGASRRVGASSEFGAGMALCVTALYLFLALRRVYGERTISIALKAAAVFLLTLVVNGSRAPSPFG